MTLGNDGGLKAEAGDVVGLGHGRVEGPRVQVRYKLRLPEPAGGHGVRVTDRLYPCDKGTSMNRSQVRRCGIKVAERVATLRPMPT